MTTDIDPVGNARCAMADTLIKVAEYHLSGKGAVIAFIDGGAGTMKLEYNGRVFEGRQLYDDKTAFGRVISAVIDAVPDASTTYLSLVVPAANRPPSARSVPIGTFVVITTERTSIAGPDLVEGQIQSYKVIPLAGNAW